MESKKSILNVLKYGAASLAVAGATYLGAHVLTPNYAHAEEPARQEQAADMKSGKFDIVEKDKKAEYCNVPPAKPALKIDPKPKGKKKAPEAPETPCTFDTAVRTVGDKPLFLPLTSPYGADCTLKAAKLNAGEDYVIVAPAGRYFEKEFGIDNIDGLVLKYTVRDAKHRIIGFVVTPSQNAMVKNYLDGNDEEDLELKIIKAEAKVETPKKEDFTPVPAPKPVEQPKPTAAVVEEESDFDFAAEADMGYVQNTQDLSGSQITSSGFRTGVVIAPSFRLSKNVSLGADGKFSYINYPSIEVDGATAAGNAATEHQFGGGLLLNIKGNNDKASPAGDLKVVFGGGYLGTVQQMNYMGYHFEQNQNGGDFFLAVNAPRLIYADKDSTGFGLEGSVNGRILKTSQDGPGGSFGRGSRFDMKGNIAAFYTHPNTIRVKAGLGGTSIDSLLVDAGRKNGSHLVLGIGSPDGEAIGWEIEGTLPYGVDNDEYGAEARLSLGNLQLGAEGKMYNMPTGTGNGDTAENQTIYTGLKASYSTDFDMKLVKMLNHIFGGN